jgi:hypothetical protein
LKFAGICVGAGTGRIETEALDLEHAGATDLSRVEPMIALRN